MTTAAIAQPVNQASDNAAGLLTSVTQIARRVLLKFIRSPQLVVVGTLQGAMFLLIFRYVFGGAITTPGIDYVNFVVPGFIATGVLFNAMYSAVGMAEDLEAGLIARLRSLPIPRSAVLVGRALADTGIQVWGLVITIAIGFAVGFRLHDTLPAALEAAALIVLFGIVFEWLFLLMGMIAGSPQASQGFALLIFPLTFVSSAYVPVASMPAWLQGFAENQPVTVMVNAVRTLTEGAPAEALVGHPASYFVVRSLIWSLALIAIFAPLAVAKYRRG
ncbi:MAG: ABC transporter permease [Candidatus Dormibacteraeota bacterium]|nr:ABC transporter permease [Candidatus Dormibacteraeota bacterium]MBV9526423.1 ABC transporter permease [Candidatus Dormibacteraeota bacterium]